MGEASLSAKLAAEFVGTFLLVLTVGCNVLSGNVVWGGVSIACVLMVAIYSLGGISGGNFNPAVSVALGLCQKRKWSEVGAYCVVQILGGLLAGLIYYVLFGKTFVVGPAEGFGFVEAGLAEVFYTFMLCFVVLNVAAADKKRFQADGSLEEKAKCPNQFYGLAIGFVVIAGAYGAGAISGGCFNPAVAIGIDVWDINKGVHWGAPCYLFFELLGAALAAGCFRVLRPEAFDEPNQYGVTMGQKLFSEFLGTFMLVLTVGLNVLGESKAGVYSIAASLMCMIYALGDVSGAHFNPAVTLACHLSGRCPDLDIVAMLKYMCAQIAGGVFAGFCYTVMHSGKTFPIGPAPGFGWTNVAVAEVIFTFVLCFVVLCCAVASETKSDDYFGLCIGSCVTAGGLAIGSISGGSLNPAVSIGIASAQTSGALFSTALAYSAFELIGGAMAAGLLKVTHAEGEGDEKLA